MRTPKIEIYAKFKDYKRRFMIRIDKHLRKESRTRKQYRMARRELRLGLPDGLGNYSRVLNKIFIPLETIGSDMTCNGKYKKNYAKRFTRTFALVMSHEFLHYCFSEEEKTSGVSINPGKTHNAIRYMTKYTIDEIHKEVIDYYLADEMRKMKRARRTVGRVRISKSR